ncbi:hypothetical protein HanXRQr2_Chr10g0423521 [Helianthus annuus]|uniref:Uncharacterized protein n=1 Tax=Helianthus annuus TaxID=4232 RepID=A0A251TGB7_HELAN|nr:hypothetical protein HanXRQr2_Chr10g0423521 [Helianthus annuus]
MNLSIYVLSWSSSSQMLLVWWMGGTILLFLLGVKSLKAPEEHISLVMPNSSSIVIRGECLSLTKRSLRSGSRNSRGPKVTGKYVIRNIFAMLFKG